MDFANVSEILLPAVVYLVLFAVIFLAAKWAKDLFTSYSLNKELAEHDNASIALTMSGYYIAVALIFVSQLAGPSYGLTQDIFLVGGYSVLGILLLNLSRWVNDKAILRTFCNIEKLTKEQNNGVGAIQFGVYLATGLVVSGALSGQGSVLTFFVFFLLGQLSLVAFTIIYNLVAPYDLYAELEKNNFAAAVGFSGALIGLGIIVKNSVTGDFVAWNTDLLSFAGSAVLGFIFLPLLLRLVDRLVIPGKSLSHEITHDQSVAAGLLVASIVISFSLVLVQLF
ncbi:DUF350 domain-containing protein [Alteromonas sp. KUL49]|uniref:DUF350 domain-containing protein n=1 Tax=Alteromonas sp. KUL49 TaxID=2480798 RepID=UPI00102EDD1B|nr:DUF350 domain-containing protein [Alteromonas sp. KUL49]TAP39378.1 DUF350 domain-containing protein [Alteromonas sp. KUL49]GEA12173.1 DUF350 domain-containing protein [Alteromonas sp. KUL49]